MKLNITFFFWSPEYVCGNMNDFLINPNEIKLHTNDKLLLIQLLSYIFLQSIDINNTLSHIS